MLKWTAASTIHAATCSPERALQTLLRKAVLPLVHKFAVISLLVAGRGVGVVNPVRTDHEVLNVKLVPNHPKCW